MHPSRDDLEGFFSKLVVNRVTGCWLWNASLTSWGYGAFRGFNAHAIAYRWFVGPTTGLEVDHLCCHKRCVNPAHLEAVTKRENFERWHRTVTHCKRGHEFTPDNTGIFYRGAGRIARYCLTCRRMTSRRARQDRALRAGGMR